MSERIMGNVFDGFNLQDNKMIIQEEVRTRFTHLLVYIFKQILTERQIYKSIDTFLLLSFPSL